jgi:hypothetical protein
MLVAPKVGIASVMRSEASSRLSRWERNFWMRRRGAKNRNQKAPTRAETKIREGSGRKSAQKGPIWLRIGNVRFAETGWWWAQSDANPSPCYLANIRVIFEKKQRTGGRKCQKGLQHRHFSNIAPIRYQGETGSAQVPQHRASL